MFSATATRESYEEIWTGDPLEVSVAFTTTSSDEFREAIISHVGASRTNEPLLYVLQDAERAGKLQWRGMIHTPQTQPPYWRAVIDVKDSYDRFVTQVLNEGPNSSICLNLVLNPPLNRNQPPHVRCFDFGNLSASIECVHY